MVAKPDIAANPENRRTPVEASSPHPGNNAEVVASPQSTESVHSPPQIDAKGSSRVLTPEQVETKWRAETRDESWAATVEMALDDYLARQPHPNALGLPSIECRVTLCRVVTSVDIAVFQATPNADLQVAMGGIQHESLGRELVSVVEGMSVSAERPDQITMSAYLQRV